jgi:hypothetical protein
MSMGLAVARARGGSPRRAVTGLHVSFDLDARDVRATSVLLRVDRALPHSVVKRAATHAQDPRGLADFEPQDRQRDCCFVVLLFPRCHVDLTYIADKGPMALAF